MTALKKYGIKKKDWICYGEWQQPPMSAQFWVHYYQKDTIVKMKLPSFQGGLIMLNGYTLVPKQDLEKLKRLMRKAVKRKDRSLFDNYCKDSLKILGNFRKLRGKMKPSGGIKLFKKFIEQSRLVYTAWWLSVPFSDHFGELLVEEAEKLGIPATKVINYIPKEETMLIKQHRQARKIKQMLERNDKGVWRLIRKHVKEFDWVGTHHLWGHPFSVKELMEEIKEMKEPQEEVLARAPREISFMTNIAGKLSYVRTYCPEVFNMVAFRAIPLMKSLAKKLGLTYGEFLMFTPDEIVQYLEKGEKPAKEKIGIRKKGFCVLMLKGKEVVIDHPKEVGAFLKEFVPQASKSPKSIKGQTASGGQARGNVKVFLVPENMEKMKKGDILVTTMTTPDFVPLMKKAGAIVTDIGGLLTHAAIVSRELGIPCIVGTKVATKVLKDGDLVEVDANKGVVRKLK